MYRSSIDALRGLIEGRERGKSSHVQWRISQLSEQRTSLLNGIEYCYVEVTFSDGAQYGIQAYGDEADELRREASHLRAVSAEELPMMLAISR